MATIEQIRSLLGETEAKIEKTINDQVEGIVVNAVDKVMADRVDGRLDGMQKAIDELQANVKVTETRLDDMASAGHVMDAWGASASSFTGTGNGNKRRAVTGPEGDAWSQYVGTGSSPPASTVGSSVSTRVPANAPKTYQIKPEVIHLTGFGEDLLEEVLVDAAKKLMNEIKPGVKFSTRARDGERRVAITLESGEAAKAFLSHASSSTVDMKDIRWAFGGTLRFKRDKTPYERSSDRVRGILWQACADMAKEHSPTNEATRYVVKANGASGAIMLVDPGTKKVYTIFVASKNIEKDFSVKLSDEACSKASVNVNTAKQAVTDAIAKAVEETKRLAEGRAAAASRG